MTTAPTNERVPHRHPVPEGTSPASLLFLLLMPLTVAVMIGIVAYLSTLLH